MFWDTEYRGVTGLYDEYRDALSVGMYRSGIKSVNNAMPSDLERARNNLLELPDLMEIRYTIDGAYSRLPEGNLGLVGGHAPGATVRARGRGPIRAALRVAA